MGVLGCFSLADRRIPSPERVTWQLREPPAAGKMRAPFEHGRTNLMIVRRDIPVTLGLCALLASTAASADPEPQPIRDGTYIDTDGSVRDVDEELERRIDHRDAHVWRTWREMVIGLSVLSVGYWLGMDRQVADWDNPRPEQRLDGTAWRTDNNALSVNFALHPAGGGVAYAWARAYHHNVYGAAAYGFLSQFIWEFVLEFKEKVSVNDMIVTPTAGIPIGEFFHKLGLYLDSAQKPGTGTQIAQWSLGAGVQVDRWLDERDHEVPRARDSLGMTSDIWHDFTASGEAHWASRENGTGHPLARTAIDARLVSIPGYLKPGRFSRSFWNADVTSAQLGFEVSEHYVGATFAADTLIFGQHTQNIEGSSRPVRGAAFTSGMSVGFSYLDSLANDVIEKWGALHMLGPGMDLHLLAPGFRLDLSGRASFDYVGITVLDAFQIWHEENPRLRSKGILRHQDYLYAWGGSERLSGRLRLGPLRLDGLLVYGQYRSQDGLNRWQEKVEHDTKGGTELLRYRYGLQIQPPCSPMAMGISNEVRLWKTWLDYLHRRARVDTWGMYFTADF